MNTHSQVVICGAGPVGLATALRFAQKGLEVTIIDAGPALNDSPRACVYFGAVQEGLDALSPGLMDELRSISFPAESMAWYSPGKPGTAGPGGPEASEWWAGVGAPPAQAGPYAQPLQVGQEEVGALLVKHLSAFSNIQIQFNTKLVAMDERDDGITLHVDTPQGRETIKCDWLIGADGAGSKSRELAGIEFKGHTWGDRFFATNVDFDFTTVGLSGANACWDPHSYAVIVRVNKHGVWRIAFGESASLPIESAVERATARLSEFIPEGSPYQLLRLAPYNIHQRAGETLRKGRLILAGDAAHATNPIGGLGLSTGFWDAFILGDLLPAVIKKEVSDAALDAYSAARLKVFWEKTSPMASANKTMMQESDPAKRLKNREIIENMLYTPQGMARWAGISHSLIGDPILPNSPWQKYHQATPH